MHDSNPKCPGCKYDLRGMAAENPFCPECGAFLSNLLAEGRGFTPPLVLYRTVSGDDDRIIVRNASLPPGVVESHLKRAAYKVEKWAILGIGLVILAFLASCYFAFVHPSALRRLAQDWFFPALAALVAGHIALYKLFIKRVLVKGSIKGYVRASLRKAGHDICLHCGWLYSDEQSALEVCPHCGVYHRDPVHRQPSESSESLSPESSDSDTDSDLSTT